MTKVAVLGGGYAGLRTVRFLVKDLPADTEIVLVSDSGIHTEKTNLHEVAAGTTPANRITFEIEKTLNPNRVKFVIDTVQKIDLDNKQVILEKATEPLSYDYVVVALGFRSETFGIQGAEENALGLSDIDSAIKISQHIEKQIKHYQESKDPNDLKIAICGAGFTGVEMLGELIHSTKKWQAQYQTPAIEIYSIEASTRLLPMFDEGLADFGVQYLKDNGVKMLTGAKIARVEPGAVVYLDTDDQEQKVEANSIVWTVGVSGSKVMDESGFAAKRGRVIVEPTLNIKEHPEVFVVGDVSAVMDETSGRPYPTTAQISFKQGAHAAENIAATIKGEPMTPFTFHSQGTFASIGRTQAIGQAGNKNYKGYPASVMKKIIVDRSLVLDAGFKMMMSKGRFDMYH